MKKQILLLSLLLASMAQASENIEPPMTYTLHLDNAEVRLLPGESQVLRGDYKDPVIKIIPDNFRTFSYCGVTFRYPSGFGFEADFSTPGVKLWTLDGNDSVIMLQYYRNIEMTAKGMADQLLAYYGSAAKGKPKKISYKFNNKKYSGFRVSTAVTGTNIFQDVIGIPTKKGSRMLIIQDLPSEEKVSDDETKLVFKFLNNSLTIGEIPPNP